MNANDPAGTGPLGCGPGRDPTTLQIGMFSLLRSAPGSAVRRTNRAVCTLTRRRRSVRGRLGSNARLPQRPRAALS